MMARVNIFLLIIVCLGACQKQLEPQAYINWFANPENGLRQNKLINDEVELSMMYQNETTKTAQKLTKKRDVNTDKTNNNLNHCFQFRIKGLIGGNILQYKQSNESHEKIRISHFSFEAKKDFKLITKTDTLPCKLAVYSRNYNLSPTVDLTLYFPDFSLDSDIQVIYNDSQFNLGRVKFLFKKEDFQNIPKLIY